MKFPERIVYQTVIKIYV